MRGALGQIQRINDHIGVGFVMTAADCPTGIIAFARYFVCTMHEMIITPFRLLNWWGARRLW
jgi:hypothetical protein